MKNPRSTDKTAATVAMANFVPTTYAGYTKGGIPGDVAFPFGYGLSCTTFAYSDFKMAEAADNLINVTVTVKNTGDTAGKGTVQIYARAPYTDYDKQNGVEKASVQLVGFGKTQELAPGVSETLEIVAAMREVCHHNLYAIANSCGMNGVGKDTTIKLTQPGVVTMATIISCAAAFFLLAFAVMWVLGVRKLRKTPEYAAFKGKKKART